LASELSTGLAESIGVAAALVESDAVGRAPSDGATVGVAAVLAPAESFVSSGPPVAGATLPDGAAVGVAAAVEVTGGLADGLAVGLAAPCPPAFPPPFPPPFP
jgi:hypothetical protein